MKTPISWVGNKSSILNYLYASFPTDYDRYIEPFGGSAAVLLGKPHRDKMEVINDYSRDIVNLYRCMRDRPIAFIHEMGFLNFTSRDDFRLMKEFLDKTIFEDDFLEEELKLTEIMFPPAEAAELAQLYQANHAEYDLKRAVTFLRVQRTSFSSTGKSFGGRKVNLQYVFKLIQDFHQRMQGVIIENQDFEKLIKHYDRKEAFFYCDPPYYETEDFYNGFNRNDHLRLRRVLDNTKGKWLVSYNDCEEIRYLYRNYNIMSFDRVHQMAQQYEKGKRFGELLIANYDFDEQIRARPQQSLFSWEQ